MYRHWRVKGMSESGMCGIQVRGMCVFLDDIWSRYTQMCALGCERDLWEGYLGVRLSGGSCVWTYVLMSGCAYVIGCQRFWVWRVLDLGPGVWAQRCGWGLMLCVWVQGMLCAGLPGGFETLPLELTIKSNFLKRWLVLRSHHGLPLLHTWPGPCGKEVPSKERDLTPGTLVRAPSPHSPAKEREKENALPEVTQHAGLCFDLTLCEPGMGL